MRNRIRGHLQPEPAARPEPVTRPEPLVLDSDRLCDWPTAVGIMARRLDMVMTALRTLTHVMERAVPGETPDRAAVLEPVAEFGRETLEDDGWISELYTGPSPRRN